MFSLGIQQVKVVSLGLVCPNTLSYHAYSGRNYKIYYNVSNIYCYTVSMPVLSSSKMNISRSDYFALEKNYRIAEIMPKFHLSLYKVTKEGRMATRRALIL